MTFLKLLDTILASLNKQWRLTLYAVTLSVLIWWGLRTSDQLEKAEAKCAEIRKIDRDQIAVLSLELKVTREKLLDAVLGTYHIKQQATQNDSVLREQSTGDVKKIMN